MSRITRFAARDPGPAARVSGFLAHLRDNGLRLGVGETGTALSALTHIDGHDVVAVRLALKAVCASSAEDVERFDDLFDSYWCNGGRVRERIVQTPQSAPRDHVHSSRDGHGQSTAGGGSPTTPDGGEGDADADGQGRLIATRSVNLNKKDLRELVRSEDIAAAEAVAMQLGKALRDRRSRRRKAARRGDRIHFRKVIRHSIAAGGEPIRLPLSKRPDRPLKIVTLCDVSGSMTVYARVFLSFVAGLLRTDPYADAYLFHTKLVRIAEALRDRDAMRAIGRLSLLADGFGGGSKIGQSLLTFSQTYARRFVDGRTVVLILSDGYDTDPPDRIEQAMRKLRKRGCRIVWLNPLKGWRDYQPVASSMVAALPYIDVFQAANRLEDLAALDTELVRL